MARVWRGARQDNVHKEIVRKPPVPPGAVLAEQDPCLCRALRRVGIALCQDLTAWISTTSRHSSLKPLRGAAGRKRVERCRMTLLAQRLTIASGLIPSPCQTDTKSSSVTNPKGCRGRNAESKGVYHARAKTWNACQSGVSHWRYNEFLSG